MLADTRIPLQMFKMIEDLEREVQVNVQTTNVLENNVDLLMVRFHRDGDE